LMIPACFPYRRTEKPTERVSSRKIRAYLPWG